jgi:hypothetical protein
MPDPSVPIQQQTPTTEAITSPEPPALPAEPTAIPAQPPAAPTTIEQPEMVAHDDWSAMAPLTERFIPQQPERITLHHEGVIFDGSRSAREYLQAIQRWVITSLGWPDIPYHFIIDLDGTIYEGRPLNMLGDTHTSYDLQNMVQVAVLGKYDAGEQVPEQQQLDAIVSIMSWIALEHSIPADAEHIKGHRDYIEWNEEKGMHIDPVTGENITCPGDTLYKHFPSIIHRVAERLSHVR